MGCARIGFHVGGGLCLLLTLLEAPTSVVAGKKPEFLQQTAPQGAPQTNPQQGVSLALLPAPDPDGG